VPFVGDDVHQATDNSFKAIDEPLRRVEAVLTIDNKKGLRHGVCSAPDKSVELAWQLYDTV
jgi:hypothetical protein